MTIADVIRGKDGRIAEVVDGDRRLRVLRDQAGRITGVEGPSVRDELIERIDAVAARSVGLAVDGWQRVSGDLLVHLPGVRRAAIRLGVTWPTTIRFMTEAEEIEMDAKHGGTVNGFRAPSHTRAHVIVMRDGNTAAEAAGTIAHELVHCRQVEALGDLFDATYLADDGVTLERLARERAATVSDIQFVRPADPREG